jgi:hypothetical protein
VRQHWGAGERVFQKLKGLLTFIAPEELMVLSIEGDNRYQIFAISFDKWNVEVCKAQESPNVMEILLGAPLGNSLDLSRVHGDSLLGYNHAEVGNLFLVKLTLVSLEA